MASSSAVHDSHGHDSPQLQLKVDMVVLVKIEAVCLMLGRNPHIVLDKMQVPHIAMATSLYL